MSKSEKRKDSDSSVQKQLEISLVTEYEKRTGFMESIIRAKDMKISSFYPVRDSEV